MISRHLLFLIAVFCTGVAHSSESSYWEDRTRGWFWYEDPPPPIEEKDSPVESAAPDTSGKPPEVAALAKLRERVETARAVAIMSPTYDNVRAYLEIQKEALDRSALFADLWRRTVWSTPGLDYSQQFRPTNSLATRIYDDRMREERHLTLGDLAESRGLFFFFSSDCPYCEAAADAVRELETRHGFRVLPVSLDGSVLTAYPDPLMDNGTAAALGVETVPAYYMADPSPEGDISPLGFGLLTAADLEERIMVIATAAVGGRF